MIQRWRQARQNAALYGTEFKKCWAVMRSPTYKLFVPLDPVALISSSLSLKRGPI